MKKVQAILAVLFMTCGLAGGQASEKVKDKELSLSLGDGLGDFHSSFAWGFNFNFALSKILRAEFDLFYYFNPTELSTVPGLAITSTGLSLGLSGLCRWTLAHSPIILEAGAVWGQLVISETWRYSSPKHKKSKRFSEPYVGPAAGLQVRLDGQSGVRFDFRYLYIPYDGRHIPRLSIGYSLWF
jgi:hypothetical protein